MEIKLDGTCPRVSYECSRRCPGKWHGQSNSRHEDKRDAKVGNLVVAAGLAINGIGFAVSTYHN
jgi:hypothetical protein